MTNQSETLSNSYDRGIVPAEVLSRIEREQDSYKQLPVREGAIDTTRGYTVDQEGLINNYAIEPEMYINEPGDLREQAVEQAEKRIRELKEIRRDNGDGPTEERDPQQKGPGLI